MQAKGEDDALAAVSAADRQAARIAFEEYLAEHGTDVGAKRAEDYDIELKPLGKSTWLVYATWKRVAPSITRTYLVDRKGVREATLQNLVYAHDREFGASGDEKEHRRIIESLIEIHSSGDYRHPAVLISSTDDIPDYGKVRYGIHGNRIGGPLDPDVEPVIRPSWKDEWPSSGYLFYVVYTYNRLGGIVSRYKFQFNSAGRDEKGRPNRWGIYYVNHIRLGSGVGDFTGID